MKGLLRYIFSFAIILIGGVKLFAQTNSLPINNRTVKYKILFSSFSVEDSTMVPSKYAIEVRLTHDQLKAVKKLRRSDWISFLNNTKMDWAANLLLYEIYGRDAYLLEFSIKNRQDWVLLMKEDDLNYWKKYLK